MFLKFLTLAVQLWIDMLYYQKTGCEVVGMDKQKTIWENMKLFIRSILIKYFPVRTRPLLEHEYRHVIATYIIAINRTKAPMKPIIIINLRRCKNDYRPRTYKGFDVFYRDSSFFKNHFTEDTAGVTLYPDYSTFTPNEKRKCAAVGWLYDLKLLCIPICLFVLFFIYATYFQPCFIVSSVLFLIACVFSVCLKSDFKRIFHPIDDSTCTKYKDLYYKLLNFVI